MTVSSSPGHDEEIEEVYVFPASFAQQGLWFIDRMEGPSPRYNVPVALRLRGPLDGAALSAGLNAVVHRHESLRTRFLELDGRPMQIVEPECRIALPVYDLSALAPERRERELRRQAEAEAWRTFDLRRAPLLRGRLLRLGAEEHVLILTMHHIVADGWSVEILVRELAAVYGLRMAGAAGPLPDLPLQLADHAAWQTERLNGRLMAELLGYWARRLRGLGSLDLKTDKPRPQVPGHRGAVETFPLRQEAVDGLTLLGRREGATRFVTLLAVLQALLHRYTGQTDVPVGVPVANREPAAVKDLIGLFLNTLVLRGDLRGDPSFRDLLRRTKEAVAEAMAHQDLPFDRLVEALRPERDLARHPLFQVMFVYQQAPGPIPLTPELEAELMPLDLGIAHFDLHFEIVERGPGLTLNIEYSSDLFVPPAIQRMGRRFARLLSGVVACPDSPVHDLPLDEELALPPLRRGGCHERMPLSFHQERLWFIDTFETGNVYDTHPAYHNIPLLLHLTGRVDAALLSRGLAAVVARHEALRTGIHVEDGSAFQAVRPAFEVPLEIVQAAAAGTDWLAAALEQALECSRRPFDPRTDPLIRAALFRSEGEGSLLLLAVHHLVADRRSLQILARELGEACAVLGAGGDPECSGALQYGDFSRWQRDLPEDVLERLRLFWTAELAGGLAPLELPTDRPRHAVHLYAASRCELALGAALTARIGALSAALGCEVRTVLLTAFEVLLCRYSGQSEIVLGLSDPQRHLAGADRIVGPLANLLVLRGSVDRREPFSALLTRLDRAVRRAHLHGAMPFDRLVLELRPEKDMSRTALFDVLFDFQAREEESLALGAASARILDTNLGYGKYDLSLFFSAGAEGIGGQLVCQLVYNRHLFDAATLERMGRHLIAILTAVAADPALAVSDVPLLNEEEIRLQLVSWNRTEAGYPRDRTVHELFEAQADRAPDRVAVTDEGATLTYRELDQQANRLARCLRSHGVGPEALVGVCLERSGDLIAALLAVMKAGGAYVPLDPDLPADRLRFIAADAGLRLVITRSQWAVKLGLALSSLVLLDTHAGRIAAEDGARPARASSPANLIYCLYTSGSTGQPKGVLIEHRNVVRLLRNDAIELRFTADDVWTMFHSYGFDFSVWEMLGALLHGGRLVIVATAATRDPAAFLELLCRERVTVLSQTPSFFYQLADEAVLRGRPLDLRYVIFGGEALAPLRLRSFQETFPGVELVNMYGITETTVHVTAKRITRAEIDGDVSNIGRPIPTTACYLLDQDLQLLPPGVPGEICVGGEGVGRGYLNRQDLDATKLVPSPYQPGERLYRSGDLGKYLANGEIVYLGRADDQVQVRGFRVELGEVRSLLLQHPAVRDAVVLPDPADGGSGSRSRTDRLIAYVRLAGAVDASDLRGHLSRTLPEHMVPSVFVPVDLLPLTANGKLDVRLLPAPASLRSGPGALQAPAGPVEQALAEIWAEVLGVAPVGSDDDFFALGGHSLLAMRLLARVRNELRVEVSLREMFEAPTVRGMAAVVSRAPGQRLQAGDGDPVLPVPRGGPLPMSSVQARLWFLHRLEPGTVAYHLASGLRLQGALDVGALRRALCAVERRHETLRTWFEERDGHPVQWIEQARGIPLPMEDLSHLEGPAQEIALESLLQAEARRPFDLGTAPMFRVRLCHLGPRDHVLAVTLHHMIADGWSVDILVREVTACYAGALQDRAPDLPTLPVQYADYAHWQQRRARSGALDAALAYWTGRLRGLPVLDLPFDRPRPLMPSDAGASWSFVLPAPLVQDATALSRKAGGTRFTLFLAAFQVLLSRFSEQADFALGVPVALRSRRELQDLIGCFVNTLVLRADLADEPTFRDLLTRTGQSVLEAHAHQELPFDRLVEALGPERASGAHPLVQVLLNVQEPIERPARAAELAVRPCAIDLGSAQLDLALYLEQPGGESRDLVAASFVYRTELFDRSTLSRMEGQLLRLLAAAVADAGVPVSRLPWLSPGDEACLWAWNDTAADFAGAECLHGLVAAQVERTPDAIAVELGEATLTYRELSDRAQAMACVLRALGVGAGTVVAVCCPRSLEMVIGLLAVLDAGGAYLPLDPELPLERLAFLLADAGAHAVLTVREVAGALPEQEAPVLLLDEPRAAPVPTPLPRTRLPGPDDLAYVIYTSGSTGRPKGVMATHRGIRNRLLWMQSAYGLGPEDRVLQKTPYTFDVSVWELFWPLLAGARLVLARPGGHRDPAYLARLVAEREITTLHFVPSMFEMFLREPAAAGCRSLRRVFCSGEALLPGQVSSFFELGLTAELHNLYGPTEASVDVTAWPCAPADPRPTVPVGRPIANTRIHVLDRALQPVPIGVPGMLYIGGVSLARGYSGRPDLTAGSFLPDPFATSAGARMYRTGDRARYGPDGALQYLGRADDQVKLRGHRIELGEVESVLRLHPAVRDAVAAVQGRGVDSRLAAYVVPAQKADENGLLGELQAWLEARLPSYMVPSALATLERIPVSANGKLDRKALPAPKARRSDAVPPSTELERRIAGVWREVLGIATPGVHDNFFEIGGHSLLLLQVHRRLRDELGLPLEVADLFRHPTIAALVAALDRPPGPRPRPAAFPAAGNAVPVAIVGMAGRFPGAPDVDTFWRNVCAGRESISFFDEEELRAAGVDPALSRDAGYVPAAGALDGIENFDAELFGYSPADAAALDPQGRIFLECALEALEDAGCDPDRFPGLIGVYGGTGPSGYLWSLLAGRGNGLAGLAGAGGFQLLLANDKDFLTTRTSYKLGLRGPSVTVQTACSTSLVAVHLACEALASGACDLAVAGGASVAVPHRAGYLYEPEGILSPDGHCAAFDADARGTVPGSGAGIVVLKRLADALADGGTIYAVIKAAAVNNDGHDKVGFTAPAIEGQAQVIAAALSRAGVGTETIGYVEAHGTGTPLGDLVEVAALRQAFGRRDGRRCLLGSVKTNIGHLDAAAGIAGLIKAALAVSHGVVPPSLNYRTPNPRLQLDESPFQVSSELQSWPLAGPRRAGVSSFGIGGTNAHAVLEEAPRPALPPAIERDHHLLVLSAHSEAALDQMSRRLSEVLESSPGLPLADVAFTLQTGRRRWRHRRMVVCAGREQAVRALRATGPHARRRDRRDEAADLSVAFLMPGRSTESLSWVHDLRAAEPVFREHLERGLTALESSALRRPALFLQGYALARWWSHLGIVPRALFGYGAGEIAAACLAGVFSFADALALASSGRCPARARLSAPRTPFVSSVTATWITAEQATDPEYWASLPDSAPQLPLSLETLLGNGDRVLLGVGPEGDLSQLARASSACRDPGDVISSLPATAGIGGTARPGESLLSALGELWLRGAAVDWTALHGGPRRRVRLPAYPFQRQRFWIDSTAAAPVPSEAKAAGAELSVPVWSRHPPRPGESAALPRTGLILASESALTAALLDRLRAHGIRMVRGIAGNGFQRLGPDRFQLDFRSRADHLQVLKVLDEEEAAPGVIVLVVDGAAGEGAEEAPPESAFQSALPLVQALQALEAAACPPRLEIVTTGGCDVTGEEPLVPEAALLQGLALVGPQERPDASCRLIDLERRPEGPLERDLDALVAELLRPVEDRIVAIRHGHRWLRGRAPLPEPFASPSRPFRRGGVYLITGGLGRMGLALAEHLSRHHGARLVLCGRRIRQVEALEAAGAEVLILPVDVADPESLRAAMGTARERFGALHGIIHAAGATVDDLYRAIPELDDESCRRQFRPKVQGTLALCRLVQEGQDLDFVICCSSLAGTLGGLGLAAHAAASAFLDTFAARQARSPGTRWISIAWDGWRFEPADASAPFSGEPAFGHEEGITVLERILAAGVTGPLLAAASPLEPRLDRWVRPPAPSAPPSRRGLPGPLTRSRAARDDWQQMIAEVWQDLLGIERIGMDDDFFTLGGDSLLATQVVARLSRLSPVRPTLRMMLEAPTVAQLAACLEALAATAATQTCSVSVAEDREEGEI